MIPYRQTQKKRENRGRRAAAGNFRENKSQYEAKKHGKGSTYRIKTKVLWIRQKHEVVVCADLRCGRRFVEKSGALVPSRTQWWGRKSCARKQHTPADEPLRRPTSLSLSLSRQASVFLLHCHFIFPKPTFQMCPRLAFLRLKFTPRWEKRPQRRASFELGPKGGIISFLHGRLRFGRHYMIVRFDEEITRNSHVSGWGGSRKSKHLGRGRWKISGGMDRTVYN